MTDDTVDSAAVKAIIAEVGAYIADLFARFDPATHLLEDGREAVTIADVECEQQLATRLLQLLPGSIVIGEEDLHFRHKLGLPLPAFSETDTVWFIDPIDGTRSFKTKRDNFGMMVGLQQQGILTHGWIYHPVHQLWVEATPETGVLIQDHPVKLADAERNGLIIIDEHHFPSHHHSGSQQEQLLALEAKATTESLKGFADRHLHSYSCNMVEWLLRGKVNYLFHANPLVWDNAAGVAIYRTAGGIVRLLDGSEYLLKNEHDVQMRHRGLLYAPDEASWQAARAALAPLSAYFTQQGLL